MFPKISDGSEIELTLESDPVTTDQTLNTDADHCANFIVDVTSFMRDNNTCPTRLGLIQLMDQYYPPKMTFHNVETDDYSEGFGMEKEDIQEIFNRANSAVHDARPSIKDVALIQRLYQRLTHVELALVAFTYMQANAQSQKSMMSSLMGMFGRGGREE